MTRYIVKREFRGSPLGDGKSYTYRVGDFIPSELVNVALSEGNAESYVAPKPKKKAKHENKMKNVPENKTKAE